MGSLGAFFRRATLFTAGSVCVCVCVCVCVLLASFEVCSVWREICQGGEVKGK